LAPVEGSPVVVRGRADHLATDAAGGIVITDFKTGTTVVSVDDALHHPQLATYQLALARGAVDGAGPGGFDEQPPIAGAELVYLRTGAPVVRAQPAMTEDDLAQWEDTVRRAAA